VARCIRIESKISIPVALEHRHHQRPLAYDLSVGQAPVTQ
jgi:hypothetical protein